MPPAATPEPPPPPAWRLEAFDLRAGLAFATWRLERTPHAPVRDWPCLFFSAPDFSPETVDNVAAALAATRGSFDDRLFVDGQREAAFATPQDVAEFLRRAFLSSGAGDGADGAGPASPPGPEGTPPTPDVARSPEPEPDGVTQAIRRAADDLYERGSNVEAGESVPGHWSGIAAADPTGACLRGAQELLDALAARLPATHAADGAAWLDDLRGLGAAFESIGLWPLLRMQPRTIATMQALHRRAAGLWPPLARLGTREFAYLLFATDAAPDDLQAIEQLAARPLGWAGDAPAHPQDPMDLLERLPVPASMRAGLPADLGAGASAMHLLSLFVAAPFLTLAPLGRAASAAIDLACFGAAVLAVPSVRRTRPHDAWPVVWGAEPTPMQRHAVVQAARAGTAWLVEHLPVRGFEPGLEAAIHAASGIRYR